MTQTQDKPKGRQLETWNAFETELKAREGELAALLPPNVNRERFVASAVAAIKQTPALLEATTRSLFTAITKSAQDGLLPDGREGVITVYNTKIANTEPAQYEKVAQWNPMTHGLRKRARELDDIVIDAQVVHELDEFLWKQGDEPSIEHKPPTLGSPRGALLGAYAIFKKDGKILHREVMSCVDIEKVRKQSRAENSLMWTTFVSEGYRKTVIRRGIKSVPVSEILSTIVRRDEEDFDFSAPPDESGTLTPPRPQKSEFERGGGKVIEGTVRRDDDVVRNPPADGTGQNVKSEPEETVQLDPKVVRLNAQLEAYEELKAKVPTIESLRDLMTFADDAAKLLMPDQVDEFDKLIDARQNMIMMAAKAKK